MPVWLVTLILNTVIPAAVTLLKQFGLPALEQRFPSLIPLVTELLTLLGSTPTPPSAELQAAAGHYNALISK